MRRILLAFLVFFLPATLPMGEREAGTGPEPPKEETSPPVHLSPFRVVLAPERSSGGFLSIETIAVDRQGSFYVIDSHEASLHKLDADGRPVWEIEGSEWGGEGFLSPRAIAVSSGFALYLIDPAQRRIYRIDSRGEVAGTIAEDRLKDPRAIALSPTEKLVVYDDASREVAVLDAVGGLLWSFKPNRFRGGSRVGIALRGEEEICLFHVGSKRLEFYHFMGGWDREWKPTLPDGRELRSSSVQLYEDGRLLLLDDSGPGLYLFDRLGNLLLDMSGGLVEASYQGPGEVRRWGDALYLADKGQGKVFAMDVPADHLRSSR